MAEDSPRLSETVRNAIKDKASEKYVSVASAWEVALKLGAGKLKIDGGLQKFFEIIDDYGFSTLAVEREYLLRMLDLPEHHKDPFDRLLIATAIAENMAMITSDQNIQKYDIRFI
jgi:PIN domain nuclease of toxin-antitoxin system